MATVAEVIDRLATELGGTWEYNARWQRWYRAEDGATAGWEVSRPYSERRPDTYEVSYTLDGLGLEVADVDGLDALIRAMRALEVGAAAVRAMRADGRTLAEIGRAWGLDKGQVSKTLRRAAVRDGGREIR